MYNPKIRERISLVPFPFHQNESLSTKQNDQETNVKNKMDSLAKSGHGKQSQRAMRRK
jgi:hypothetical protein